jgi:hypothetical protein
VQNGSGESIQSCKLGFSFVYAEELSLGGSGICG